MPRLNKESESTVDFHFPKAGVERSMSFGRQPTRPWRGGAEYVRTAPDAANVRGYDPKTTRDRGGSRPGLARFINAQVNGTFITQHLNVIVTNVQAGATMQTSLSGRVVTLVAVSQGEIRTANPDSVAWVTPTNNTGNTPPLKFTGVMQSAQNNQKLYFADGVNWVYYQPADGTVNTWAATKGTLPVSGTAPNDKPRLICTWRGRTVLSGILNDPQNWFMSRVSDPHDFDYGATPVTADMAVSGNNADLGQIGDVVTALIPLNDDELLVGGDSTIYRFRGDPMAGGQIDRVSDAIGIAFGQAWCKDPVGNVYFFSNTCGIYRMSPGAAPLRISQAIDHALSSVDTGENVIRLMWNDRLQGMHIFITPAAAPAETTHYFWEGPRGNGTGNAWWPDVFANDDLNPPCCVVLDGNDPNDRVSLLGSWDGYVRALDFDAVDDDGTPIASYVVIGPIMTREQDEMFLREMQAVMAETSGQVTYTVHVGSSAEAALSAAAAVTGTWEAGRNNTSPIRRADHAVYVKIAATTPWAMETIRAVFGPRGKVRRRN